MSALSLESEDEIEVSAQCKEVILSSPKQTTLLPVTICPEGEPDLPACFPRKRLFPPEVRLNPAAYPTRVLLSPVKVESPPA